MKYFLKHVEISLFFPAIIHELERIPNPLLSFMRRQYRIPLTRQSNKKQQRALGSVELSTLSHSNGTFFHLPQKEEEPYTKLPMKF